MNYVGGTFELSNMSSCVAQFSPENSLFGEIARSPMFVNDYSLGHTKLEPIPTRTSSVVSISARFSSVSAARLRVARPTPEVASIANLKYVALLLQIHQPSIYPLC